MNPHIVAEIEKLLNYDESISDVEVNRRVKILEDHFRMLFKDLPNFSVHDKAVFLKLLTRSNDLLRKAMDIQMKNLNLNPEKLKNIFAHAEKSDAPEARGLVNALQYLQMQATEFSKAVARASVKLSQPPAGSQKAQSAEGQRLKRSKWQKP